MLNIQVSNIGHFERKIVLELKKICLEADDVTIVESSAYYF